MNFIMEKRLITLLVFINAGWSITALFYDWGALQLVPIWLLPFIIICPLFPGLLSIGLAFQLFRCDHRNRLLTFASYSSLIYLAGSLVYYPTYMRFSGFNWLAFGQIFWVAFYGLQGLYIFFRYPMDRLTLIATGVFLGLSFYIQLKTGTFDYLDFSQIPGELIVFEYTGLFVLVLLAGIAKWRSKSSI